MKAIRASAVLLAVSTGVVLAAGAQAGAEEIPLDQNIPVDVSHMLEGDLSQQAIQATADVLTGITNLFGI